MKLSGKITRTIIAAAIFSLLAAPVMAGKGNGSVNGPGDGTGNGGTGPGDGSGNGPGPGDCLTGLTFKVENAPLLARGENGNGPEYSNGSGNSEPTRTRDKNCTSRT